MAAIAVAAESAPMGIVGRMATNAGFCHLQTAGDGLSMACRALQVFVRSLESEAGPLTMVESPNIPSVRIVAGLAVCSECLLVNIIRRMTRLTCQVFVLEGMTRVTGFACDHRMQTEERKRSQLMVKRNSTRKRLLIVTISTVSSQIPEMDVVALVTADTTGIHFLRLRLPWPGVTRHTRRVAVGSHESEVGPLAMVEVNFGPFLGPMTVAALDAETSGMHVFTRMTSRTILGELSFSGRLAVAGDTAGVGVGSLQGEAALLLVIEALLSP